MDQRARQETTRIYVLDFLQDDSEDFLVAPFSFTQVAIGTRRYQDLPLSEAINRVEMESCFHRLYHGICGRHLRALLRLVPRIVDPATLLHVDSASAVLRAVIGDIRISEDHREHGLAEYVEVVLGSS